MGKGAESMFTERLEQVMTILTIISNSEEPLGSGAIKEELSRRGHNLSEATVGRILRALDTRGLTERIGYRGRTLTTAGKAHLEQLLIERKRALSSNELLKALKATGKEKLLDVLVARRAIERENARLAALHATREELEEMERIIIRQKKMLELGQSTAATDVQFHKLLAAAAKNRVLEAATDLIRQDGQLTPIMEYIRQNVGSTMVADHLQIFHCVAAGDAGAAEAAMVAHIDNLISDVQKYWEANKEG
jgi:GntR family transcriptional repressor for pyruvate dehydrogenase complex